MNTGTTNETLQQSGKQDSFRHLLKSSVSIYESSSSSLTILGVAEIFCTFRLDVGGKTSEGIPKPSRLEFLEKFLANNFVLSDAEDHVQAIE